TGAGYHLISELRHDADLRHLYAGGQKPEGRPEMSDGKVRSDGLTRSEFVSETDNVSLHTAVVNSPSLKRNIRIVYPVRRQSGKVATALLFSADIHLRAADIHRFYKARFQIEFLFRDAKQSAGLPDCQARCEISPDFRFNACMTALNLMKWESRRIAQSDFNPGCSVASVKIRNFNGYLLERFCSISGIDFSSIKSSDAYHQIINLGAIAA
ncbi:MAG TPA: transposase, partial [Desulfobacteraceae bacterium]|nr:transposase [Desulfobacteraceae bacterium]